MSPTPLERLAAYRAPRWLVGGHAQTLWAATAPMWQAPLPSWQRTRWPTPDGDFVDVDWLGGATSSGPLLVLLHGLEGSSRSPYAAQLARQAVQRGWRLAVPHFRGCSGEPNRTARAYHAGDVVEVAWFLTRLRAHAPGGLWVVGVSLGGNALLRWAAEYGEAAARQVTALAAVCAPLDLAACGGALARGLSRWLYTPWFLRTMKAKAAVHARRHPDSFDVRRALAARSLAAFDDAFTAPLHGFAGVADYWARASAGPHLAAIRVPALVLNPLNDPFVPTASLPRVTGPWVQACRPAHGGHVGFVGAGPWSFLCDWLVQPGHG
ncbi:MAG: alpha/beta fold hydrolase [Proteobacteria bacterium]|nr:alpha/beta fold hydrolase [Pseudomonadota bacterium]